MAGRTLTLGAAVGGKADSKIVELSIRLLITEHLAILALDRHGEERVDKEGPVIGDCSAQIGADRDKRRGVVVELQEVRQVGRVLVDRRLQ